MFEIKPNCCRICFKSDPNDADLQDIEKVHYGIISATDALKEIFQLVITKIELESSDLPRKICTTCTKNLQNSLEFWNLIQDSKGRIKEWKDTVQKEMTKIFIELSSDDEDSGVSDLSPQKEGAKQEEDSDVECTGGKETILNKIFGRIATKKEIKEEEEILKVEDYEEKSYKCEISDNDLKVRFLAEAKIADVVKRYTCHECGKKCRTKAGRRRHILKVHPKDKKNEDEQVFELREEDKNDLLGMFFDIIKEEVDEEMATAPEEPTMCSFLPNLNSDDVEIILNDLNEIDLDAMKQEIQLFNCPHCPKSFAYEAVLHTHLERHNIIAVKEFACGYCNREFKSRQQARKHIMTTHETGANLFQAETTATGVRNWKSIGFVNRPRYPCQYCSKRFVLKKRLNLHMKVHFGNRNFTCNYCQKVFFSHEGLMLHIRSHTGGKPFSCPECLQTFAQITNLNTHLHSHADEPFKCFECGERFRLKQNLDIHINLQHNHNNYC